MTIHHSENGFRFTERTDDDFHGTTPPQGDGMGKNEPSTDAEWQLCVDACTGLRMIEDAKLYGLLEGGPEINMERIDYFLERAAEKGIQPSKPPAELAIEMLLCWNSGRPWMRGLTRLQ